MAIKILILIIFIPQLLFASSGDCDTDLNQGQNSPFNSIPIYDQDGVGLCYAYTTSQMIDYYRFSQGAKGLTNPIYAGWATYYKDANFFKSRSLQNGGHEHQVVEALKKVGVCEDNFVSKRLSELTLDLGLSEAQTLHFLESVYKNYNGILTSKNWDSAYQEIRTQTLVSCSQALNIKKRLEQFGFLELAPTYILDQLFKNCKTHAIKVPDVIVQDKGTDNEFENKINDVFKRQLPVTIGVCSSLFTNNQNRDLRGIQYIFNRASNANIKKECGPHSVLLTAQKKINGECNYLIRNSWGASWYPPTATSCACITRNRTYKQFCQKGEGEEYVGCWFKKNDILPNTSSITYFK